MFSNWVRPRGSNLGQVWREFTAGNCERFHIRLLTDEWVDQCMDILDGFIFDDPTALPSALGLQLEPESVISLREWVRMYLGQNITYGCFLQRENEPELLVAVDVLYVRNIRDEFPSLNLVIGEAFKNYIKFIKFVELRVLYTDVARPRCCNYLMSFGVLTRPNYRNLDIENNMIALRQSIARELRINFIGSAFIGTEMQSIAENNKYRLLKELTEEKLCKECGLYLDAPELFPIKIMKRRFRIRASHSERKLASLEPDVVCLEPEKST